MNTDAIPIRFGQIMGLTHLNLSRIVTDYNRCAIRKHVPTVLGSIIEVVCSEFGLSSDELLSSRRPDRIALPRQIGMALAYKLDIGSMAEIAKFFNRTDHSTVVYAVQRVGARCETEPKTKERVERIESKLRERL